MRLGLQINNNKNKIILPFPMSVKLSNHKKQITYLSNICDNKPVDKQNDFLRNYSQLIDRHFSLSKKQRQIFRMTSATLQRFKIKTKKNTSKQKQRQFIGQFQQEKSQIMQRSSNTVFLSQTKRKKSEITNCKMLAVNPQVNQRIERLICIKTLQVQKDSYQNVIMNKKLIESKNQKNRLTNQIQRLKLQIGRQNNLKAKISTNLGKLMNKHQERNNLFIKTENQRNQIDVERQETQSIYNKELKRNHKLQQTQQKNLQRIRMQRQMIDSLRQKIQKAKAQSMQTKTLLSQLKAQHMTQQKCLTKVQMNFQQLSQESNNMCNIVSFAVSPSRQSIKMRTGSTIIYG